MAYKQKSLGGPLSKMFKRDPKKLAERNQRRHERNLRVDWDPNKINDFNRLYEEGKKSGNFDKITGDASYSKGSGQGGTDVGNYLRMMKKNMMLPSGQTNTQPPKENDKIKIKKDDKLDTSFALNPHIASQREALAKSLEAETGISINHYQKDQWEDRWLK